MVEVFTIQTFAEEIFAAKKQMLMQYLPPQSRERVNSYTHPASQQRTLLGEAMARNILSEKTGIPPAEIVFALTTHGKPVLKDIPAWHFNISHSGEWVAMAVANNPVGIDVEKMGKPRTELAKRFFSEEETQLLLSLPEAEQRLYFYRLWTIKESYLKTTGDGLTASLNSFTVKQEKKDFFIYKSNEKQAIWVKTYDELPNYCLAATVATELQIADFKLHIFDWK